MLPRKDLLVASQQKVVRELTGEWLPAMWTARFGEGSLGLRLGAAFVGGGLMAFGASSGGLL